MDALFPDLAYYWLAGQGVTAAESTPEASEREASANESALALLADRIVAARSIT